MLSIELRRRSEGGGETGGVMRPNLLLPLFDEARRPTSPSFALSMRFLLRLRRRQRTNEARAREGASPFRVTVNLSGFRSWLPLLRSVAATKRRPSYILHLMPLLYVFP